MKKSILATALLSATLFATPLSASANNTKPSLNSKHWQTSQVVKASRNIKTQEHQVQTKDKKLVLTNKIKKSATIKKGTELSARYMGNGVWQVASNQYSSSKAGVWLINAKSTNWFNVVVPPKKLAAKWSTQHFVTTTNSVKAQQLKVTTKNKKLTLTNTVLKSATIKSGTQLYARNMGNGVWQIANNDYPSNNSGVWIVKNDTINWFKVSKAPTAKQYQLEASRYQTASSNTVNLNNDNYTNVYAPYGFKPLSFDGGFTINAGQQVSVKDDAANNRYILHYNNQDYALTKSAQYQFSTANVQKVGDSGNNVQSTYEPYNTNAVVPNGYQPQNGNLWIQIDNNGNPVQYYFYTTQNGQSGWAKAKVESQNGKNTIVPE